MEFHEACRKTVFFHQLITYRAGESSQVLWIHSLILPWPSLTFKGHKGLENALGESHCLLKSQFILEIELRDSISPRLARKRETKRIRSFSSTSASFFLILLKVLDANQVHERTWPGNQVHSWVSKTGKRTRTSGGKWCSMLTIFAQQVRFEHKFILSIASKKYATAFHRK